MADRELGAGAWSYFGDPRAISHDGDTFTGWISTTGNVWVARYTAERQAHQELIFSGLGRDDHNNPSLVFRPRRAHHRVLLPALGPPLPPPGHPERDALHVSLHPYSIDGFGPVHTVPTNVPGGLGYTYPNPIQLRGQAVAVLARRRLEPDVLLHRGRPRTGRRPASSCTSATGSGPMRSTSATAARIHGIFTDGHPTSWKNSLHYMRYEAGNLFAAGGRRLGSLSSVPLHTSQARPHLPLLRPRRARVGARHRAHARGPAAGRLHAPGRQPRHLLLRLPQRHAVDQPQDRRGRRRPPLVPLRRRVARPRGPALRLPLAHDRPLEPGRAVVHARRRPHVDARSS